MRIAEHFGHSIVIAKYSDENTAVNYSVECEDCFEVLFDEEVE